MLLEVIAAIPINYNLYIKTGLAVPARSMNLGIVSHDLFVCAFHTFFNHRNNGDVFIVLL